MCLSNSNLYHYIAALRKASPEVGTTGMGKLRHGDGDWDGEAREFDSGEHTLRLLVTVRFNTAETCRLINRVTAGGQSFVQLTRALHLHTRSTARLQLW